MFNLTQILKPDSPRSGQAIYTLGIVLFAALVVGSSPLSAVAATPEPIAESPSSFLKSAKSNVGSNVLSPSRLIRSSAQGLIYIAAVFILGTAVAKKLRKAKGIVADELISIKAQRSIGPRLALLLIEVKGRSLLIAQSAEQLGLIADLGPGSPNRLSELDPAEAVDVIDLRNVVNG